MPDKFTPGQQLKAWGIDMQCRPILELVRFEKYLDEPQRIPRPRGGDDLIQDCVIVTGCGIRMIADSRTFIS